MGSYSVQDHIDLFGGLPDRGEAIPDLDAIRDQAEDWPWTLIGDKPAAASRVAPCGGSCGPEGCMARGCPVADDTDHQR